MIDNWKRYSTDTPPEGERILISDCSTEVIARYVTSDSHRNWIYDEQSHKDIEVIFWQELPQLPPKIEVISAEK